MVVYSLKKVPIKSASDHMEMRVFAQEIIEGKGELDHEALIELQSTSAKKTNAARIKKRKGRLSARKGEGSVSRSKLDASSMRDGSEEIECTIPFQLGDQGSDVDSVCEDLNRRFNDQQRLCSN